MRHCPYLIRAAKKHRPLTIYGPMMSREAHFFGITEGGPARRKGQGDR
jgi:hypothetical protein